MTIETYLLLIIVAACANWRLTTLLTLPEDGPYLIIPKLRRLAGIKYDEYSNATSDNELGKILICPNCTSVWIGIVQTLLFLFLPMVWLLFLFLPFALSAITILINKLLED